MIPDHVILTLCSFVTLAYSSFDEDMNGLTFVLDEEHSDDNHHGQ